MNDYRASHVGRGGDYDVALAASPFDAYMGAHEHRILREVLARLYPKGVDRYVDFACGTGRITALVEPYARASIGIDVSESMIAIARPKCLRTTFVVADVTTSPVSIEPVDLVTAFRFFGNAQPGLRAAALRAIAAIARPGGHLILNNHRNPRSLHNLLLRVAGEPQELDLAYGRMDRLLRQHGFEIVETHAIAAWVVLYRLHRHAVLTGRAAPFLERLSALPGIARVSPDAVLVARRTGAPV